MNVAHAAAANAGILRYLDERARHFNFPRARQESGTASIPTPYGTHPDLVERLWETLTKKLPEDCHWVVHGTPVLIHPSSGIIFGFAIGTSTYALRLPPEERDAALRAGASRVYHYPARAAPRVESLTIDLADIGEEWVFGAWNADEADWCLAAYYFAQ